MKGIPSHPLPPMIFIGGFCFPSGLYFTVTEEMGELLYMSTSSYSDIETGVTNCVGTLTATRLLSLQENPSVFLRKAEEAISKYIEKELQPV